MPVNGFAAQTTQLSALSPKLKGTVTKRSETRRQPSLPRLRAGRPGRDCFVSYGPGVVARSSADSRFKASRNTVAA
jgi:hypothetical protein